MSTTVASPDLRVNVATWPGCAMPKSEIVGALTYLACKTGKPVRCTPYRGSVQYAVGPVHVYACTVQVSANAVPVSHVTLDGIEHELRASHRAFHSEHILGEEIKDDEGLVLAKVDHNCIVILVDITAADNEAGRAILSHVVERAIPLLNFDVADQVERQKWAISEQYETFHKSALRSRIADRTTEVHRLEREETDLYFRLVNTERELPLAKQELEQLEKTAERKSGHIVEKQAEGIMSLIATGQYEEVTPANDGSLYARTSNILIEHNDWVFELARYEINIDATGKVTILSADGIDADGYPHPHVDGNGKPCWGNIGGDVAKAIGRMRVFETLTLLYDFVASYNPDGPFIRIGKFDDNYDDPDEDRCEDCDDYHSPYCIAECGHNGAWSCSDCGSYRTSYCYADCEYNLPGFQYVSPCDDCSMTEAHCFLVCEHNEAWEQNNPCTECSQEGCDGCDYADKKAEVEAAKQTAAAS